MLDKMSASFKETADLQLLLDAKEKTIISLSKKIQELEAEIRRLNEGAVVPTTISLDDEETIARIQLTKLKDLAFERELTLEEARKLEIYNKIITNIESRVRKKAIPAQALSTEELLTQITGKTE